MRKLFKKKWISKTLMILPIMILGLMGIYALLHILKPEMFRDEIGLELLKIDSCLDSGGCWDYLDKVCRKDEPNAQELCHRKK